MDFGWVVDILGAAYNGLVWAIQSMLSATIFRANAEVANEFAGTITLLASLTAVYILLVFVTTAKKVLGVVLLIGWAFLLVSIVMMTL